MDAGSRISPTRLISGSRFAQQWSNYTRAVIVFLHVVLVVEGNGVVIAKRLLRNLISVREGCNRLGDTNVVRRRSRNASGPPTHRRTLLESVFHAAQQRGSVSGKGLCLVLTSVSPNRVLGWRLEERSSGAAVEIVDCSR